MDFVPVSYSKEEKCQTRKSVLTRLGVGTGLVGAPVALLATLGGFLETAAFGIPIAIVGGLLAVMTAVEAPGERAFARKRVRSEQIRTSLNEHYGLSLTQDQFKALDYPEDDPGPGFQTLGSIKVQDQVDGANFLERTLYLTATDGELKLSESRDGKRFKELKPVRHAVEASASASLGVSA